MKKFLGNSPYNINDVVFMNNKFGKIINYQIGNVLQWVYLVRFYDGSEEWFNDDEIAYPPKLKLLNKSI